MAKIDEIKEHIGALKTYLTLLVATMLALGAGVAKLYRDEEVGILFWIGLISIMLSVILFVMISRSMHSNIKKLKDL
jgi:ACR3 family arsenite efflux pump ArsB